MVGHVEWVQFARVDRVPRAGEVVHARDPFEEPAGGGAVAAVQLARLAGAALLVTALGEDELGRSSLSRLRELGVEPSTATRAAATRKAVTLIDAERRAHDHDVRASACSRSGATRSCRGASSRAWTPSTSPPAMRGAAGRRAQRRILVASPRALRGAGTRRSDRCARPQRGRRDRAARGRPRAGRGRARRLHRGRARRSLPHTRG